jgi:integrase
MNRRHGNYGSGTVEQRAANRFRLTHYVGGKRQREWVNGTRSDANRRLRELTAKADAGEHVPASGLTLKAWAAEWMKLLARGEADGRRRRGLVTPRTRERYQELLAGYVFPALGHHPIQKLTPTQIDHVYIKLEQRLSATTVRHVHVALKACLATAVRKGLLARNPASKADPPRPVNAEIGRALTVEEVTRLLAGFAGSIYYPIVATAVMTGMRLNEILALRWTDVSFTANTISVTRTVERTKEFGAIIKEPKSWRGKRAIGIDPALAAILKAQHDRLLRLRAGVSATAVVSLGAVRLPAEALVFPAPPVGGGKFDFAAIRNDRALTKAIREKFCKLGFRKLRFHDLRATHSTALLDAGVPVHTVAGRMGHRAEILLKAYAKRTRTADDRTAGVLAVLAQSLA